MVRLDPDSKTCVARAAGLRHVSVSDYVRSVVVAQARREIHAAEQQVIALTPAEQQAFWQAASNHCDGITRDRRFAVARRRSMIGSRARRCRIRRSTFPQPKS